MVFESFELLLLFEVVGDNLFELGGGTSLASNTVFIVGAEVVWDGNIGDGDSGVYRVFHGGVGELESVIGDFATFLLELRDKLVDADKGLVFLFCELEKILGVYGESKLKFLSFLLDCLDI